VSITDDALARLKDLILSGQLEPGSQLPPEQELASQLGASRSSMREAVRALTYMRLVEVRRGLGTFVTGLEPALLLEGVRTAAEAARDESIFEIFEDPSDPRACDGGRRGVADHRGAARRAARAP
jgi:GntR family transcriptional repressor for pyruvate dehydrogenase complex